MSDSVAATIVLAEDDSDLRAIYAQDLREAGHVVWEAEDGGQALALVRARSPELLLLDIWMPILNGLEVLERLSERIRRRWGSRSWSSQIKTMPTPVWRASRWASWTTGRKTCRSSTSATGSSRSCVRPETCVSRPG